MTRLFVLLALALLVAAVTVWYRRRAVADAGRGAHDLPALPADLRATDGRPTWVILTTPWCTSCDHVHRLLTDSRPDDHVVEADVTVRPSLADDYEVRRAPTVLVTDAVGNVVDRFVGVEAVQAALAQPSPVTS